MKRALLALLAASLLFVSPAHAWLRHLAAGGAGGSAPQTIASVTPSTASFTQGTTSGTTIATLVATMSPSSPGPTGSFAPSTSADICNGTNGANNNLVQVSGSSLQVSTTGSSQATGTYAVCIAYTQPGISNSPKAVAITLTISASGGALALQPQFNQPTGTTTPATAFWRIGYPMLTAAVPVNGSVTATLGGTAVRVAACNAGGPLLHSDSSPRWYRLLVDYSGVTITPGSSKTLVLTPSSTPWSSSSSRTTADIFADNDTITMASVTGSTAGAIAGTWTADFSNLAGTGTGTIYELDTICTTPLGNIYHAKANFKNGSTTFATACSCTAVPTASLYFWATQTSGGALGPITFEAPSIENMQMFGTNPQSWTATMTWLRNGVSQRSQVGIPIYAATKAEMPRIDGQDDYSANDPGIDVTWDYTQVRATRTIPPVISGITYVGGAGSTTATTSQAISAVSSTGVFTIASGHLYGLTDPTYFAPTAVDFIGSFGSLTGLSQNTPYWQCALSASTFEIFTTYPAAAIDYTGSGFHCPTPGTTNVVPGGTGSYSGGMSAEISATPETYGLYDLGMPDSGNHDDLTLFWWPEWAAAGIVGNTQAWHRLARTQAYALWTIPQWVLNSTTGCIPSLMNTANTPSTGTCASGHTGMGTAFPTVGWPNALWIPSGIITAPTGPPSPSSAQGFWNQASSHFPASPAHTVELLEGEPELEDLLVQIGNHGIAGSDNSGYTSREFQVAGTGTTYSGQVEGLCTSGTVRLCVWNRRDASEGMYWAPEGSDEQTYFRTERQNDVNGMAAYIAYTNNGGSNYSNLGFLQDDDTGGTTAVNAVGTAEPYTSMFMHQYNSMTMNMDCALNGEFTTGLCAQADIVSSWQVQLYDSGCSYWWDGFNFAASTSDTGSATPSTWVSDQSLIAVTPEENTTVTINVNGTNGQVTLPNFEPHINPTKTIVVGDEWRPQNWGPDGIDGNPAPSPLVDGTTYCVVSVVSSTADTTTVMIAPETTHTTPCTTGAGSTFTSFSASVTGIGGMVVPAGQTCPPTTDGSYASSASDPNSYNMWNIFGLGAAAARFNAGIGSLSNAPAAYTAGAARTTGVVGLGATQANVAMGSSF